MTREPVILLPGLACDAHVWQAQRDALAEIAACRAIVPDGDSMDAMAADILSRAPDRFALAGLSMGGYVALAILRRAPGRVSRVCLANTSARPDSELQQAGRLAFMAAAAEPGGFEHVITRLLPVLVHPDHRQDVQLRANISDMMRRSGGPTFIRQQKAAACRPDSRAGLARIAVPACIIAGRADRVTPPEHAVEMANAIDGATLHVLENCGHLTPMEAPAQVTGIMRAWLAAA
jgi:pimeloyl-ACP methyl ester carboxylesterase